MIGLHKTTGSGIDTLADHVRQSIGDIITTPVGSRVMRRDYGSVIPDLIDQPLNSTTVLRLYAATAAAVMRWEPRFRISSIRMQYEPPAGVSVEVSGRLGDDTLTTTARIGGGL
jgi:phage baseplate assembly protein W